MRKKRRNNEQGEIMLEGMIVMVVTMFILIWILGLGFLYYQRYTATIVTNDAAVKIASTYNNPTSDIIMGYVTSEDISNRNLYRNFTSSNLVDVNKDRAESYVEYILNKANFTGVLHSVEVDMKLVRDSLIRKHIELTTVCVFKTPFGEIFEMFGMDRNVKFSVKACADYTDISDYITTVNYIKAFGDGTFVANTGFINSLVKMLNSFVDTYNKVTS